MLMLALVLYATDPAGLPPWTAYPAIALLLSGIGAIVRFSITGTITWPPQNQLKDKIIADQAAALKEFQANANRAIPTTQRVVEWVEERQRKPDAPASNDEVMAAVRELSGVVSDLKKGTPEAKDKGRA